MTMYKARTDSSSATAAAPAPSSAAAAPAPSPAAAPCNCGPAAPAGPGGGNSPAVGVALTPSLEELIYFNGRFLKAEDFQTEQKNYLLRIALAERAQGAGVSYGFHVTATSAPTSATFVDQITQNFMVKVLASDASRRAWAEVVGGDRKPAEVSAAISAAVEEICKARPGHSDTQLVIGRGHAADGWGSDLYLKCTTTVKLQALIDAYVKYPTTCTLPGPSITPVADPQGAGLSGAYLLCASVNGLDFGKVPIYGVQCGDNAQQVCSLGYHSEGVALQLVFFPGVTAAGTDAFLWRGEGARRYFDAEIAAHGTRLPLLGKGLPFSGEADAPASGTHVPIGVVYLSGGDFVAYDEWTAKRLRTPAEMSFWLGALLEPSRPAQLARVVQFQSQLTEALAAAAAAKTGTTLWNLGFASGGNSPILELPGVGFLPVGLVSGPAARTTTHISPDELAGGVNAFFDGVPYRLLPATAGQMNAIFGDALESGPLKLTRKGPLGVGDPKDKLALIEELLLKAAAGIGGPGGGKLPEEEVPGIGSDVVGFIGEAGPVAVNQVKQIDSWSEFQQTFEPGAASTVLGHSVLGFFLNGGTRCAVINVGVNASDDAYVAAVPLLKNENARLLAAPGKSSSAIQEALLKACEDSKSCFALLDSPEVVTGGVDALVLPRASKWGVFLYPWVQVQDPEKGNIYVPPSGLAAGVYIRTERQSGQPPINEPVMGALGVRFPVSRKEQAEAAAKRINLVQLAAGAIRLSSVYTITPNPEAMSSAGLEKIFEDNCLDTLGQIAGLVDKTRESLDEPQVFVWYPERRDAYQGYVMFTWPIAQLGGCITTPEAHLTVGIEMTAMRQPTGTVINKVPGGTDTTRSGAAAPTAVHAAADTAAARAVTVNPGIFAAEMVPARSKLNEKVVLFRDSEWAGPIQIVEDINLGQALPDGVDEVLHNLAANISRSIILTSLRISIDPAVCDLGIKYAGRDLRGRVLEARGEVDGKWLRSAKGFSSLRIGLTGADKDRYDVRYMARFRLLRFALETSWCENYEEVSVASIPPAQLGGLLTVVERIGPILPIEAIYVKVIPKGTPAASLSRFAARWTSERTSVPGILKKEG